MSFKNVLNPVSGKFDLILGDNPTFDSVQFDLTAGITPSEGQIAWDDGAGTVAIGMPGGFVVLQVGQEMLTRVKNDEGAEIGNGLAVYVSGGLGVNPLVKLADNASFATAGVLGLATESIATGQFGFVTTFGLVRELNTTALDFNPGDYIWLNGSGTLTKTRPTSPDTQVFIGICMVRHVSQGIIIVRPIIVQRLQTLSDVFTSGLSDADIYKYNLSNLRFENVPGTVKVPISLQDYDPQPARVSESNIHGGILALATGQPLNSVPTDINVTKGIGKIIISVNAGSDIAGSITITGEVIDRNTGASTLADTDVIIVDALSIDGSDTDGNGNMRHSHTDAYISSKWFTGAVVISTADLTLTDVDVYHVSFEQFNDSPLIEITTFDANVYSTNVAAELDAYLYTLEVIGSKCDITRLASLNLGTDGETAIANKYWRLRRGNLAKAIDGTTDGVWVDVFYSNSPAYIEDVTFKVWVNKTTFIGV